MRANLILMAIFALCASVFALNCTPQQFCLGNTTLLTITANCTNITTNCPYGCLNGACLPPPSYCGNGVCSQGETCSSCPADCGPCPPTNCTPATYCIGNTTLFHLYSNCTNSTTPCQYGCYNGACLPPPSYCGNGVCSQGETCSSCPADCGPCPPTNCTPMVYCNGNYLITIQPNCTNTTVYCRYGCANGACKSPPPPKPPLPTQQAGSESAEVQGPSAPDNTMIYLGLGVAVLVGIGLYAFMGKKR